MRPRRPRLTWSSPGRGGRDGSPWFVAPSGHLRVPWRLSVLAAAFSVAWVLANSLLYPLLSWATATIVPPPPLYPWLMLVAMASACFVAIEHVDGQTWGTLGMEQGAWRARVLTGGWLLGLLAIAAVVGLLLLTGGQRLVRLPGSSESLGWLRTAGWAMWLLAPAALWEELLFRGYLWRVAEDAAGRWVALWSTSVAFGVVHMMNPGATLLTLAVVVLAGVCLGLIRDVTQSLPAAWLAHLAWNWGMAAVAHAPVSGLPFDAPGWRLEPVGPIWWSGGAWGPEGGLGAFLVLLAALGATLWWRRRAAGRPAMATSSDFRARSSAVATSRS